MSDRFQDEYPIYLSRRLCRDVGVDEAIFLQQLKWLLREDANNGKVLNGKRWIYNTIDAWREKYFDFYSKRTLERLISKLEKQGFLESCQPEGKKSRRKYYRLPDDIEKRIDDHTAKVAGSIPPEWRVPVYSNSYDSNSFPEEKKCPPPSQARSEGEVSLSLEDRERIVTNLLNPQNETVRSTQPSAGESSDSASATNCVKQPFIRKLRTVPKYTCPSHEWFMDFEQIYDTAPDHPWDQLALMANWSKIYSHEKCLLGLLGKIQKNKNRE